VTSAWYRSRVTAWNTCKTELSCLASSSTSSATSSGGVTKIVAARRAQASRRSVSLTFTERIFRRTLSSKPAVQMISRRYLRIKGESSRELSDESSLVRVVGLRWEPKRAKERPGRNAPAAPG